MVAGFDHLVDGGEGAFGFGLKRGADAGFGGGDGDGGVRRDDLG